MFARFGADPEDNAGRLMRYELGGLNLIVDFAHNPTALAGLVDFAQHLRGGGRLALLLGQAGNREDADIDRLAAVAAAARPDFLVVKELESYLRGRDSGEVPALLRRALAVPASRRKPSATRRTRIAPCASRSPGREPVTCWCCRCTPATAAATRSRCSSSSGARAGEPASHFRPPDFATPEAIWTNGASTFHSLGARGGGVLASKPLKFRRGLRASNPAGSRAPRLCHPVLGAAGRSKLEVS